MAVRRCGAAVVNSCPGRAYIVSLVLYDTKARAKRGFVPIDPMRVGMYVCGPTVYDRAHIGNARPVIEIGRASCRERV